MRGPSRGYQLSAASLAVIRLIRLTKTRRAGERCGFGGAHVSPDVNGVRPAQPERPPRPLPNEQMGAAVRAAGLSAVRELMAVRALSHRAGRDKDNGGHAAHPLTGPRKR